MHCSRLRALLHAIFREKKQLAKARGRKHVSSDESDESEQEAGSDGLGSQEQNDPFFQQEDDVFSDPFFKVSVLPLKFHFQIRSAAPRGLVESAMNTTLTVWASTLL